VQRRAWTNLHEFIPLLVTNVMLQQHTMYSVSQKK